MARNDTLKRLSGLVLIGITAVFMAFLNHKGQLEQPAIHSVPFTHGLMPDTSFDTLLPRILSDEHLRGDARLVVTGHTGTRGDDEANLRLSEERAELIAEMLVEEGVSKDAILAVGVGGTEPLQRQEGESDRSYQRRLPRVDVVITNP